MLKNFIQAACVLTALQAGGSALCGQLQSSSYPYGPNLTLTQNQISTISQQWSSWKTNRLSTSGISPATNAVRVLWTDQSTTISEGMGYGMLLALYFDDETTFDQLYAYVVAHENSEGHMDWHLDQNGVPTTSDGGTNAATDGDEDMAMALYGASIRWGSSSRYTYLVEAKRLIGAIRNYELSFNGSTPYLISDDNTYSGDINSNTDPSYFSPAWYQTFYNITADNTWLSVSGSCASILAAATNGATGLTPNWCQTNGSQSPYHNSAYDYQWGYDAFRCSFRQAINFSWFDTSASQQYASKVGAFYGNLGAGAVGSVRNLDGTIPSGYNYNDNCFLSGAVCAVLQNNSRNAATFFTALQSANVGNDYYSGCWQLLAELYASGSLPNPETFNFLQNGSFEQGAVQYSRTIANWTATSSNGTSSASYLDTGNLLGSFMLSNWSASPYDVTTSQSCNGIPNGTYALRAWVRSSGNLAAASIAASTGSHTYSASFTSSTNGAWTLVTVENISVQNGTCKVSIHTKDTVGNNWDNVDAVVLAQQ
jgi:endo-1,4-beta-D-glucanase Y